MVDSQYRFVWARFAFPGNSHDAIILSPLTYGYVFKTVIEYQTLHSAFPLCT